MKPYKTTDHYNYKTEHGNVLFLILLVVALFAALSYAVTQSNRLGNQSASKEVNELAATQIIQFATLVENAVMRVMVSNGCADTELSFATPVYLGTSGAVWFSEGAFPNAPVDKHCHVYAPQGGNVPPQIIHNIRIPNQVYGGLTSGHAAVTYGSVPNVGTSAPDLLLSFPHVSRSVCEVIHRRLGLPVSSNWSSWPVGTCTWTTWAGAETNYPNSPSCPANTTNIRTWCANDGSANSAAYFYHVILAR